MSKIPQLLNEALGLHRAGKLNEAARIYEAVLQQDPRNANAYNLLSMIASASGEPARAVELLRQAVMHDGGQPVFHANLGEAYRSLGQIKDAIDSYSCAMTLAPDRYEFHANLGTLLQQAGMLDQALNAYRRAAQLQPNSAEVQFNLGTALQQQGKLHLAATHYEQALQLKPNYLAALLNLGAIRKTEANLPAAQQCYESALKLGDNSASTHYNLGNVYQLQLRLDDAIAAYQRALNIQPDHAEAWCNFGNALREKRQLKDASACLQRATELRPDLAAAWSNWGVVLHDLCRMSDAKNALDRALALEPQKAEFHQNMGSLLRDMGQVAQSIECYDRTLELHPNYAQALCGRGMALLTLGHFTRGWADYEYRTRCVQFDTLSLPQPRWDGSILKDKTLLLHSEQGLGDTLQFVRFVALAKTRCDNVILAVQPTLIPLLRASGFDNLVSRNDTLPQHDVQLPLLSLPHAFRTEEDTIPRDIPYLKADAATAARWHVELPEGHGLRVGIAWQGRPDHRCDRLRSIPLEVFSPLLEMPGVQWFSLQKGAGSEQLAQLPLRHRITDLGPRLDNDGAALVDTAAVMQHLDLVITSDTSIAHLAGGMGKRVWLALTFAPDWRWMLKREDSPWYPTMRLFRQTVQGHWDDVFLRMRHELGELAS